MVLPLLRPPRSFPSQNATILDATDSSAPPNTAVAMIVLYVVTGCVSLLFCIIIISGAIKAIRHPERYGPRRNENGGLDGWSRTRAGGLTRAILDTFPIVKFGTSTQSEESAAPETPADPKPPDLSTPQIPSSSTADTGTSRAHEKTPTGTNTTQASNEVSVVAAPPLNTIPAGIGRETCPICIVEFGEGDDLRVLPCDGAHRFHQTCVDPWLLELSTACPLCRHDFVALENMISGGSELEEQDPTEPSNHRTSRLRRFSRYVRFAGHRHDQDPGDTTAIGSVSRPSTTTRPSTPESDMRPL
ncbi:hypothetical protein R3P38DRAFT_2839696 [Favolaschia claudopus]|uniref:RING-type domain-containing protein n=1 Tax=Favolaschia claudopus TaxID=2862362 RepID=A0AAW0DWC0_9AGAR